MRVSGFRRSLLGQETDHGYEDQPADHRKHARVQGIGKDERQYGNFGNRKDLKGDEKLDELQTDAKSEGGVDGGTGDLSPVESVEEGR